MPHVLGCKNVRFLFLREEQTRTALRFWPLAFHHLQLLPADASSCVPQVSRHIAEDSQPSAGPLRFRFVWVRGDAGAYPPTYQRAQYGRSVDGDESVEAASLARPPAEEEVQSRGRSNASLGRTGCKTSRAFLAEAILRFQRVERAETEREDELHALQSGEERIGRESERLEMEQLPVLLAEREGAMHAQPRVDG